jgi:hypothetical protein
MWTMWHFNARSCGLLFLCNPLHTVAVMVLFSPHPLGPQFHEQSMICCSEKERCSPVLTYLQGGWGGGGSMDATTTAAQGRVNSLDNQWQALVSNIQRRRAVSYHTPSMVPVAEKACIATDIQDSAETWGPLRRTACQLGRKGSLHCKCLCPTKLRRHSSTACALRVVRGTGPAHSRSSCHTSPGP